MKKGIIFVLGVAVGAAAGAVVTKIILDDKYKKIIANDNVRLKAAGLIPNQDHVGVETMTEEDLKEYYIQGLEDLGFAIREVEEDADYYEDAGSEYFETVNPVDEEDEEEDDSDISPIEPNPVPYILEHLPASMFEQYEVTTIHYYKGDNVFTDTEYNIIDSWQSALGECADQVKSSDEDSVYVCNEVQNAIYEVLVYDDSYKHAVEGVTDEDLGSMAD